MTPSQFLIGLILSVSFTAKLSADPGVADLSPVNALPPPKHPPLVLASGGEAKAAIRLHVEGTRDLAPVIEELREVFFEKTGAKLEVLTAEAAEKYQGILIHIGDSPLAEAQGLVGKKMPPEGFAIKTAPNAIFIVGHDEELPKLGQHFRSSGTAWGVVEFMERFLGVRWYWPKELGGRSIEPSPVLQMPPTHLTDAPYFRQRVYWPPYHDSGKSGKRDLSNHLRSLRAGTSCPIQLAVHTPRGWGKNEVYKKERPEMFQLNRDGSRNFAMLDYAHPLTLQTYLEEIADYVTNGTEKDFIIGNTVTVSPGDSAVNSHSPEAQALWDADGGEFGQASKIMADFVNRLAVAMKERFPQLHLLYLPYLNYSIAPDGYRFPGNVYIQLCGMPGLAQFKEPLIRKAEQANLDRWVEISGHPIIDWHYSCWPADRTQAPYQYPNVIHEYYRTNREKTVGAFINGLPEKDEWQRFQFSLYTWLKVLWNPDFPVEKSLDEFSRRMFGPAAKSVQQLLKLQIKSWEESRWPDGKLTAQAVNEFSFPQATMEKFRELFAKARQEAEGDKLVLQRLAYLEAPFGAYEKEVFRLMDGKPNGAVRKAGE